MVKNDMKESGLASADALDRHARRRKIIGDGHGHNAKMQNYGMEVRKSQRVSK